MTTAMKRYYEVSVADTDKTSLEELKAALWLLRNVDNANKATDGELIGSYADVPYDLLYLHGIRKVFLKVFGTPSPTPEQLEKALAPDPLDKKVGKQDFTYRELKAAWEKVKGIVEGEDKELTSKYKVLPHYVYDFRNQYCVTPDKDLDGTNHWHADWSFESICKAIEEVEETITYGDLEVYWNDEAANNADSDEHGIFFEDGKIKRVY